MPKSAKKKPKWGKVMMMGLHHRFKFDMQSCKSLVFHAAQLAERQIPKDEYCEKVLQQKTVPIIVFMSTNLEHRKDLQDQFLNGEISADELVHYNAFDYNDILKKFAEIMAKKMEVSLDQSERLVWEVVKKVLVGRQTANVSNSEVLKDSKCILCFILSNVKRNESLARRVREDKVPIEHLVHYRDEDFAK
jgi:hypothetical protein